MISVSNSHLYLNLIAVPLHDCNSWVERKLLVAWASTFRFTKNWWKCYWDTYTLWRTICFRLLVQNSWLKEVLRSVTLRIVWSNWISLNLFTGSGCLDIKYTRKELFQYEELFFFKDWVGNAEVMSSLGQSFLSRAIFSSASILFQSSEFLAIFYLQNFHWHP